MRSTSQNGGVVTNGLIMCLDARNPLSYPGSGTTWYDISGNRNNFTLVNSPTYNGTSFTFNGTNQYVTATTSSFGNFGSSSFTIEYAIKVVAASSQAAILMKRNQSTNIGVASAPGICDRVGANQFFVQDDNPGGTSNNNTHVVNIPSITIGSTAHMVYTVERNGFDATGSRYLNGVLTNTDRKTFIGTNSIDNNITMILMAGSAQYVSGSLYTMRMYNRALSPSEASQNYKALMGRLI